MIETTAPQRQDLCLARTAPAGHAPIGEVATGNNGEMEWQFGTCMYCDGDISRYRLLYGGYWFDQWGVLTFQELLL